MDSKFINNETLGYLQSQVKQTTTQRLDQAEETLQQVINFIDEYDAYVEGQFSALKEAIQAREVEANNDYKALQVQMADRAKRVLYSSIVISSLITGVIVWLVK